MKDEWVKAERDLGETYWWFVGRRFILERILRRFGKHSRIAVDIGCGSGRNMYVLESLADQVIGIDRSAVAVELAASHRWPIVRADSRALPLAGSSVDLVSALDVLEHLDDDRVALDEFQRVLCPGGVLLLSVPAYRFLWSEHDEALMHRRRYVASELHIRLTCAGFRVLKRSYAVFFAFFPIVLYRLFRGLFPKGPVVPQASYVRLPSVLNRFLTVLLRLEAWMIGRINLPWGTSLVFLAQKGMAASSPGREPATKDED
jgi:SAM-dependent methyltransferase